MEVAEVAEPPTVGFEGRVRQQLQTERERAAATAPRRADRPGADTLVHWLVFASGLAVGCALASALELHSQKVWTWWVNDDDDDERP